MSASRDARKRAELLAKLRSVSDELDVWLQRSEAGERMEKHNTQVRRVVGDLRPLAAQVQRSIEQGDVGARWPQLEENVLDLHRVWGFFREKLALRRLDELAGYLALADEFSAACYEPAAKAAVAAGAVPWDRVREPPLVYLSATASPFSVARGESYASGVFAEGLTTRKARALVARLPVPVIGIPWLQLRHLPEALVIGHEVGHIVVRELVGLEQLAELVGSAVPSSAVPSSAVPSSAVPSSAVPSSPIPPDAGDSWQGWAEEAFADIYGALAGGAAYATVLRDFLTVDDDVRPVDPGYPPAPVRLRLVDAALREATRPVTTPAVTTPAVTTPAVTTPGTPEAAVARALVRGPYPCFGGRRLDQVLPPADQGGSAAQDLLQGWTPSTRDFRTLLAVTAQAFTADPARYAASSAQALVLDRSTAIRVPGTRAAQDAGHLDPDASRRADSRRVDELYALLTGEKALLTGEKEGAA